MNEGLMAGQDGQPVRTDEPWLQRSRREWATNRVGNYQNYTGGGIAATLDASYYKGPGARNGKEREFLAIENEPVVYPGVGSTNKYNQSNPVPGDPSPSVTTDSRNYMVKEGMPPRKYIVRRLTPIECARLQGFPDWWCDGADGSDSAIYKLWGNGIALPCAVDVLGRIARAYRRGW